MDPWLWLSQSCSSDLFLTSDTSICYTIAFPPLGNSDHVVVSISINFPSNSKRDALFHHISYDYTCDDSDSCCDHFTDVQYEDVFKLNTSAIASEFCECVQVGTDVYIHHQSIRSSLISVVFSCLCCCHTS